MEQQVEEWEKLIVNKGKTKFDADYFKYEFRKYNSTVKDGRANYKCPKCDYICTSAHGYRHFTSVHHMSLLSARNFAKIANQSSKASTEKITLYQCKLCSILVSRMEKHRKECTIYLNKEPAEEDDLMINTIEENLRARYNITLVNICSPTALVGSNEEFYNQMSLASHIFQTSKDGRNNPVSSFGYNNFYYFVRGQINRVSYF